jgi:hypothetical protein
LSASASLALSAAKALGFDAGGEAGGDAAGDSGGTEGVANAGDTDDELWALPLAGPVFEGTPGDDTWSKSCVPSGIGPFG